jgi:hypothetical protein
MNHLRHFNAEIEFFSILQFPWCEHKEKAPYICVHVERQDQGSLAHVTPENDYDDVEKKALLVLLNTSPKRKEPVRMYSR